MTATHRATLIVVPKGEGSYSDRELVRALRAHDVKACVLTYRKYAPRIFGIVQRAIGPDSDVQDLTQDIFLRVFSRIHTLRKPEALSSFILSVAIRVIKWQLRQRRVRRILHLTPDGIVPEIAVPANDPDARQALRRLYGVLDSLPVQERTVFVLRHVEGMDLQEIATVAGVSLATVKRRLQKGTARVNERVQSDNALSSFASKVRSDEA